MNTNEIAMYAITYTMFHPNGDSLTNTIYVDTDELPSYLTTLSEGIVEGRTILRKIERANA